MLRISIAAAIKPGHDPAFSLPGRHARTSGHALTFIKPSFRPSSV
jgi:hypothetical protein